MIRRLLVSYLSITAFVLLVLEIPLALSFATNEREQLTANIERDARVLATIVEDTLQHGEPLNNKAIIDYQTTSGARVLVTDGRGISVADSDVAVGRDYSTRPEIIAAMTGRVSSGERFSKTLDSDLVYVAVPVASGGTIFGVVRITFPASKVDARIRRYRLGLGLLAVVVLSAVTLVGFLLARSVTRPVQALETASSALAGGDLSSRAPPSPGAPELRRLSERFNQMASRIEELITAQRAFVADASHQLRTPLTALRLRLENLEDSVDAELREDLDAAIAEVARLTGLVDQLLRLARTETVTPGPSETMDLAGAIRERRDTWDPLAIERGLTLTAECSGTCEVSVTPGVVEQILDNLLANAIEVAPRGTSIALRAVGTLDAVALHVVDQGPGMSDEQRRRAFDRFWRGPATAGRDGSGLGLAIVRQLAQESGGEAGLSPGSDTGLDAWVRFPKAERFRGQVAGPN